MARELLGQRVAREDLGERVAREDLGERVAREDFGMMIIFLERRMKEEKRRTHLRILRKKNRSLSKEYYLPKERTKRRKSAGKGRWNTSLVSFQRRAQRGKEIIRNYVNHSYYYEY